MAYDVEKLNMVSSGKNTAGGTIWSYVQTDDTLATITASAYFNDASIKVAINDLMFIVGSDNKDLFVVTALSPNVTVEILAITPPLQIGSSSSYYEASGTFNAMEFYLQDVGTSSKLKSFYSILKAGGSGSSTELMNNYHQVDIPTSESIRTATNFYGKIKLVNGSTLTTHAQGIVSELDFPIGSSLPSTTMANFHAIYSNNEASTGFSLPNQKDGCFVAESNKDYGPAGGMFVAVQSSTVGIINAAFKISNKASLPGTGFNYGFDLTNADSGGETVEIADIRLNAGMHIRSGAGAPSGAAPQGSLYLRTDGSSTSTRMYVATNAVGGWTNLVTAT